MAGRIRVFLLLLLVVALVAGGVFLVKRKKAAQARAPRYGLRPIPVEAATARKGDLLIKQDYLAVVEPFQEANLSARVTATVKQVLCDEGVRVKAGQKLVVLDDREIRNAIDSMESEIEKALAELAGNQATVQSLQESWAYWKREAQRDKTLADKGDIAPSQAEATADKANTLRGRLQAARQRSASLRSAIKSLRARKAELETRLGYYVIKSPFAGVVKKCAVDPGDMAGPGKLLVVVQSQGQLKLAFDIPQQDLPRVREGQPVVFRVGTAWRKASLSHTYPSLNQARMLRAEVYLSPQQAAGLSLGQYLPLSVVVKTIRDGILLPRSCLIEGPHHYTYVFIIEGDHLVPRPVKVIAMSGDTMALRGLKAGERAVTNTFLGWARLSAANRVEVRQ